jgi:hypothetical protein
MQDARDSNTARYGAPAGCYAGNSP